MKHTAFTADRHTKWVMILPAVLIVVLMIGFPFFYLLANSFSKLNLLRADLGRQFIGFANYVRLFADNQVPYAIALTAYFIFAVLASTIVLGLLLAMLLTQNLRGEGLIRGITLAPWFIAPVVVGFNWRFMYAPNFGIIPHLLTSVGLTGLGSTALLGSPTLAMPAIIVAQVWNSLPGSILILAAGLQSIPREPYEAAVVDGVNAFQLFRYITLPFMRPALAIVAFLTTTYLVRSFDLFLIMTAGGPGISTEVLSLYQYRIGIAQMNIGYGATLGVLLIVIALVLSIVYIRAITRER